MPRSTPWFFITALLMSTSLLGAAALRSDIEYGQADGVSLRMDAHTPPGQGPFPAVILVHGGGWVRGDRRRDIQPLIEPLNEAGIAWFSISYRLAKEERGISSLLFMNKAVSDVQTAVAYVTAHAAEFNVDPDRIALIGESAGAQLASMAALKHGPGRTCGAWWHFTARVTCRVCCNNPNQVPESVKEAVHNTRWADMVIGALGRISPINLVRKDMPPFLLIHGTADPLVPISQSEEMCEKITQVGASCEIFGVPGGGHGMRGWESKHLTAYKQRMIEWLNEVLVPRPAAERGLHHAQVESYDPTCQPLKTNLRESGFAHSGGEFFGAGEFAHRFGQVCVSIARARDHAAQRRQDRLRVEVVASGEQRIRRLGKLQNRQRSAALQNPEQFLKPARGNSRNCESRTPR